MLALTGQEGNMSRIRTSRNPNLPVAPKTYSERYLDQLTDVLRLYFNQVDSIFLSLLGLGDATIGGGGKFFAFPHIAASGTTDQYADADNDATIVLWDTLESGNGFTLNLDSTATSNQDGVFKIDYSLQFANTDNTAHDVYVWLEVTNGGTTQVPDSTSKFTIQARKSAGVPSYIVAYSSITFEVHNGDRIALWWATDKAYSTTGPVNGVYMEALPAQVSPFAHPAAPAAIGSITFVSNIPT